MPRRRQGTAGEASPRSIGGCRVRNTLELVEVDSDRLEEVLRRAEQSLDEKDAALIRAGLRVVRLRDRVGGGQEHLDPPAPPTVLRNAHGKDRCGGGREGRGFGRPFGVCRRGRDRVGWQGPEPRGIERIR